MRGTVYARHMLYVHKLRIDMFQDLDDIEVIVDTQHGISFVELPMDVFYDLYDLEVIVDTQTLDPFDTFTGASVLRPFDFQSSQTGRRVGVMLDSQGLSKYESRTCGPVDWFIVNIYKYH